MEDRDGWREKVRERNMMMMMMMMMIETEVIFTKTEMSKNVTLIFFRLVTLVCVLIDFR